MADEVREEEEWLYGEADESIGGNEENGNGEDVVKTSDGHENEDEAHPGYDSHAEGIDESEEEPRKKRRTEENNGEGHGGSDKEDEPGSSGKDDESEDEDDDSDDDGVMVTIGDIKGQTAPTATAAGFTSGKRTGGPPPDKKGKFSAEDFEGTGQINGIPAQDFNLDALEDKPWRKPGADITDFFNYGFTEETWRAYSERQKRMRYEAGQHQGHGMGPGDVKFMGGPPGHIVFPKKFGMGQRKDGSMGGGGGMMPPPGIHIGMNRPNESAIQVMTADRREYSRKFEMGPPPPMMPFDMGMPPPHPSFGPPQPGGDFMGPPPPDFFNHPPPHRDFYGEEDDMCGDYEEQQWMDSHWEMEGDGGRMGAGPSALVVPLTKVTDVPPPPGESADEDSNRHDS